MIKIKRSTFEKILSNLDKTQSNDTRLETLIDLKKKVEWPDRRRNVRVLQNSDHFLEYLMNTLHSPQKAIVDATLSIFVICIMEEDFARKVIEQYDLLSQLHILLRLHQKEQSMKGLVFRILGNICKHSQIYAASILNVKPGFVQIALDLLESFLTKHVSEATIVMALRFLKSLLPYPPNDDTILQILDAEVMPVVSSFFIDVSMKAEINENILLQTIKLLHHYSQCGIHDFINEAFFGESILYLCNRMGIFLQRIPRVMSHFIKIDQLKTRPLHPAICDWIVQKANDLNIEDSKDDYVGYISCLCFILLEKCDGRHKKFIPQLIKALKLVEDPSYADMECFILIFMTFNRNCSYELSFAKDLVDCDIVQTLIEKLKWLTGEGTLTLDFDHQTNESDFLLYSECPHIMGKHNYTYLVGNDVGEIYTGNEVGCSCSDNVVMHTMKILLLREMMNLFRKYIYFYPSMPEVASEELVEALVSSSVHFGHTCLYNKPVRIEHLFHLMGTTLIEKFFDMYQRDFQHSSACSTCVEIRRTGYEILERLEKSAASEKGMEKLKQGLITENIEERARIILSIPYIFCEKSRIAHFLLQFDCLKSLPQLFKDGPSLKKRSIKFLHHLASQVLDITDPTQVDLAEPSQDAIPVPIETAAAEERLVTFKLDDGSTVQADRNSLTEKSWYFSVLLEEHFTESEDREVALHDTPVDLLRFMLQLLEHPERIDQLVMEHDLDFLLDAIVIIDRHVERDLCNLLVNRIRKCRMDSKTVAAIYRWSIESKLNLLRMEAVTFALVHCLKEDERAVMFDSLLDMGCTEKLIEDIQTILEDKLIDVAVTTW